MTQLFLGCMIGLLTANLLVKFTDYMLDAEASDINEVTLFGGVVGTIVGAQME